MEKRVVMMNMFKWWCARHRNLFLSSLNCLGKKLMCELDEVCIFLSFCQMASFSFLFFVFVVKIKCRSLCSTVSWLIKFHWNNNSLVSIYFLYVRSDLKGSSPIAWFEGTDMVPTPGRFAVTPAGGEFKWCPWRPEGANFAVELDSSLFSSSLFFKQAVLGFMLRSMCWKGERIGREQKKHENKEQEEGRDSLSGHHVCVPLLLLPVNPLRRTQSPGQHQQ